ncbi:hypothetical protein P43SY_010126 [Pythium insidiosum]|uniref:Cyclic nucleotide-binding domain-containing protein n=1 Tax=Pythium insidiosum TaxID=114742 RepID=A0AAD5LB27_PYTIN|nr:hypothetical protein P43SY_010126 [Pythium insidiosum]
MFSVGSSVEDAKSTTITNTNPAIETPRKFERAIRNLSKAWNLLMLFITTYFAITVPLKAAFSNELENVPSLVTWSAIEYLMDVICILDVSLRIRRAVHHEKFMNAKTKTQRLSALMYDGFLLDIVASLPLELCIFFNRTQFVDLSFKERWPTLCLLRLNKLLYTQHTPELCGILTRYAVYDLKVPLPAAYVGFAQSLITYVMMGHWIACMWYGVSVVSYRRFAVSWLSIPGMLSVGSHTSGHQLTSAEVDHVSLARKYMRSMHFSVGSITTTFYGDVVSFNVPEMMIEMLVNLMSIYIFGSLIAAHGEIHEVYSRKKALFEQNLLELQHFLQHNTVPKGLKRQVKSYYASIWRRRHGDAEFAAIQGLSRSLREDVVYETMLPFVCKVSGFRHLDIRFLRGLLTRLQYIVCSENEEVVIRGDIDRSMYFIDKGRVLVKQGTAEVTKEEGEFFGEMALLYGIPREETCIALSVSELYRLDHGPYEELVQEFPEQRQKTRREWTACAPASTPALAPLTHGPVHDDEIDEQLVQQGFVYRAGMQLLASLNHVDAFAAREIGWKIKDSARRHAQRVFAQRSHPQ